MHSTIYASLIELCISVEGSLQNVLSPSWNFPWKYFHMSEDIDALVAIINEYSILTKSFEIYKAA